MKNLSNITFNATKRFSETEFIDAYHSGLEAASQKFFTLIVASFISFVIFFIAQEYLKKKGVDLSENNEDVEQADIRFAFMLERLSFVVHFAVVTYLVVVQILPNYYMVF